MLKKIFTKPIEEIFQKDHQNNETKKELNQLKTKGDRIDWKHLIYETNKYIFMNTKLYVLMINLVSLKKILSWECNLKIYCWNSWRS